MNVFDKYFFHKSSTANIQYDYLDGLRGLAVLFVLFSHLSNNGIHAFPGISFSGSGKYGVFLFFTLSAFLLTLPFLRLSTAELRNTRVWLNYCARRFFRIFPLFIVVLAISYGFSASGLFMPISGLEFKSHLLLQQGKGVFWTIPVEFKYYFVLPVVALIIVLFKKEIVPSTIFIIVSLIIVTRLLWPSETSQMNTVILGPYLPIFLLGSFSALVLEQVSKTKWTEKSSFRLASEIGAFVLILSVIILVPDVLGRVLDRRISPDSLHKDFLLFGIIWSLFIVLCHLGTGVLREMLSCRPIRFIGIISFSVYLWHIPVILLVRNSNLALIENAWSAILITIIVSTISYLVIERPFMKIRLYSLKKQ